MRYYFVRLLLVMGCFLQVSFYAYSLPYYGNTTAITVNSGLNNNTIYDIHRGKKNFIWFSTDMGISRYDGFRVRNYPLISKQDTLTHPTIYAVRTICEDTDGLFYLQLLQGGIACFDQDKDVYLPVRFENPFDQRIITSLYVNKGSIYVGTFEGLYTGTIVHSENEEDGVMIRLSSVPAIKGSISQLCGKEGKFVFAVTDRTKVAVYNLTTKKVEILNRENVGEDIAALYQHGDYLWICSKGADLECYDLKQKELRRIQDAGGDGRLKIADSRVANMVCLDEKTFYVATRNGVLQLKFSSTDLSNATYSIEYIDYFYQTQMEKNVTNLFWDNSQKMLWMSTFGSGALRVDFTKDAYSRIEQVIDADIIGIEEDVKGYVWIATGDGKVLKSVSNIISTNTSFVPWTKGVKADAKYRVYKDRQGRLWLGDDHAGVVCIDSSTDDVSTLQLLPKGMTDFQASIREFCFDARNRMWIATTEGLVLLDLRDNSSRLVSLEDKNKKVKEVYTIAEDKEGNIWIGTNIGLKRIELQGNKIFLSGNYEQEAGFEVSPAYSIYVNSYNQILVSYIDKILRIDGREKNKVENTFTLMNGLSSGYIYCMVDDQNGNTWLGSNSGIMTIRNDRSSFYDYASFGNCNEVCRLHDGRLLWANSYGLIFFDPLAAKTISNKKQLTITELWVNGEVVSVGEKMNGQMLLSTSPDLQREFVFNADNNDFTLYFSDSQYNMMQRRMAYRLLPDEEWKIGTLKDGITYKRLPVGKYILQVKLVYPDASEGEVIEIPIRVRTHWWSSGWAYFGYILLAFGVFAVVYNYLGRKAEKHEKRKAREIELKESLNLSKMKQDQKQEVETMRNQLLTMFVQELRTPLSLIIAPLKEMSKDVALPPALLSKVSVAYRSSLGMLDACNQLLSIYTQTPLAEKLEVAPYIADKIVDEVAFSVAELVRINQIDFQYDKKTRKEMEIWVDKGRIRFVIHNLISNAFNHVRLSGSVHLFIQETIKEGTHYCTITVSDNGKNSVKEVRTVSDDELPSDLSGIELGYDIMEKVLQFHHGMISMKSEEGEGTEVTIDIPIGKELLENDTNVIFVDQVKEDVPEEIIPVVEDSSTQVPMPEETMSQAIPEIAVTAKSKKTLLIVEDHKDIRLYLKVLFGKDYNMLMATNGQEGIDIAIKEQPDLILCDVMMPVKDGFECCREIKENLDTCHIPFIMLTAKVEDDDIVHGLELGADDYILKPFTPSILKAKVRNLINGRVNLKHMYTKLLMVPESGGEGDQGNAEGGKMDDPFIRELVKIIEENIREADFNVKKLASDMNMSQPTLYRKVKQSTDFTIIELIRGVRMRKAAVLLKQKIYAVQEVAEMVGYNDIPTFRKHFVEAFGSTPSTYANSLENS